MTIDKVQDKVGKLVKVYFKENDQRYPMIGKFVNLKDSKDLARKKMIRFVSSSKLDFFIEAEPSMALTRIYVVTDFTQIIDVEKQKN